MADDWIAGIYAALVLVVAQRHSGSKWRSRSQSLWLKDSIKASASNGLPRIERISPAAAIPGGEIEIHGTGFAPANHARARVTFGDTEGDVLFHAANRLIARVPESGAAHRARAHRHR